MANNAIIRTVQGTFHQGNAKFGESAGKQCTCCSLFSIVFTLVKSPGHWTAKDLDFILEKGDELFKNIHDGKNYNYLMLTELPNETHLFDCLIRISYLNNSFGFIHPNSLPGFIFERSVPSRSNGLLFVLRGICIGIIWTKNHYFLFDSHSRNSSGQVCPDGYSTVLKFPNRRAVEIHILQTYLDQTRTEDVQFDIQYVQVVSGNDDINLRSIYNLITDRKRKKTESSREKSKNCKKEYKQRKSVKIECNLMEERVLCFKNAVTEGPYYVCIVCNRTFYKRTVKMFCPNNYEPSLHFLFTDVVSFDNKAYICVTCDRQLSKNNIPCQAVWNKLQLHDIPEEIKSLNRLEKVLISKRILFKKISIMPKGQQPKIKGAVCNIPIQTEAVSNSLPHNSDNSGIILVKLKRKLMFRGHVYFEAVRPDLIREALENLKQNNPFYSNILINIDNIDKELLSVSDTDAAVDKDEFDVYLEKGDENLEDENPLDSERVNCDELCVIPNIYNENQNVLDIAPGENKVPESFFNDEFCEEQAFPYLLPTGKFGYKVSRSVPLSPVKYFNQRLLNYTQRFACDGDYIFFAHYVLQQIHLYNQINIATTKVKGTLSAGQLQRNFKDTVKSFICEDKGYLFMKALKGTPAYWKQFLHDVLAMVKQIGLPTFFMTLSCADLRWDELIVIISKLNKLEIDTENLDYFTRCNILNQNPVLIARHFQFRVETFYKVIVNHKNGPLGNVLYYVIKVEFQFRGSPHIHSFIWVENAPQLTKETKQDYINFVDSIIRADLPNMIDEPKLHELVSKFQIHCHSRSCRKYKNVSCRFHYGKFFTDRTICAEPLNNDDESEKKAILSERSKILNKVKEYIDEFLDPHKSTYKLNSVHEILNHLEISERKYYWALSISPDQDYHIHLKRPTDSCFVNNYFSIGLQAWEANIDIQPVFNHYKAVSYMCSYFSKCETESSLAMKKASVESENLTFKDRMQKLAISFLSHRQCSLQEAVYQLMPELWLRKTFPSVMFANSNLPNKRYRVCKSQDELSVLPEESTDVFKRNSLDRYIDRPNSTFKSGRFRIIDEMCYADFLAYYVLDVKPKLDEENDCQPEILIDDDSSGVCMYPKSIPLMSSNEKLRCRKMKKVLRYHTPNQFTHAEAYAHHLLMLFYPFRSESELLSSETNTYCGKLSESAVNYIVNVNKAKFEPWGDLVDQALLNLTCQSRTSDFVEQENSGYEEELEIDATNVDEDNRYDEVVDFRVGSGSDLGRTIDTNLNLISNEEINSLVSSLNTMQRQVYNRLNSWARRIVQNRSTNLIKEVDPLQIFITGGAGTGKSHLIRTIFASLSKTLSYQSTHIDKPKVLLLAPTGVSAVNISGSTIHSALGIPVECNTLQVSRLSDKKRCSLRIQLEDLKAIIIDEISMVSNKLLLHIHQRLLDIFGYDGNCQKPFAGITMIVVGDLYQLPPVLQRPVYADYYNELYNIYKLWRIFKMFELTEIMRQKGDSVFIDLLNNIRIGRLTPKDVEILKSRFISTEDSNYPLEALHIFAENDPAQQHNAMMLQNVESVLHTIYSIDQVPSNVPNHIYDKVLSWSQSKTKGLSHQLQIKIGAKVMLTSNIDVSDKLINGQIGIVSDLQMLNDNIEFVFIKFNDISIGSKKRSQNHFARLTNSVPIERITLDIKTSANKDASPLIKRSQFPLKLSWACTIHKVQGLTLDKAVVSFDLRKQRSFKHGQMYVGVSRAKSLSGLFLTGTFNMNALIADPRATEEYDYLRDNQCLEEMKVCEEVLIKISLCNVRSLRLHINDIKTDSAFTEADIILCTETQMCTDDDTNLQIENYSNIFNVDHTHTYSSLAVYYKHKIAMEQEFSLSGISILNINTEQVKFRLMLLYKKDDQPVSSFYDVIRYFTTAFDIHILAGDFNVPPNQQLSDVLSSYKQLVTQATHISGSLLDHVYVKNSLLNEYHFDTLVHNIFFSDHDCVEIFIKNTKL